MHKASGKSLVKGQSSNCPFLCARTIALDLNLRRHNWIHFAVGHSVLLHRIETKVSEKPEILCN